MPGRWLYLLLTILVPTGAFAQSDRDYFPLTPRAMYVYKTRVGEETITITSVYFNGDEATFHQETNAGHVGLPTLMGDGIYQLSSSGVTRILTVGNRPPSTSVVLRFPVKVGTRWTEPNPNSPGQVFIHKVTRVGVTVHVPAGEFKNCAQIDHLAGNGSPAGSTWFAPGVGIVKDEVYQGDLLRTDGVGKNLEVGEVAWKSVRIAYQPPSPPYPSTAKMARVEGVVHLRVQVDEQGNPTSATPLDGPGLLRSPSAEYLMTWKFSPRLSDGRPRQFWFVVPMVYKLP